MNGCVWVWQSRNEIDLRWKQLKCKWVCILFTFHSNSFQTVKSNIHSIDWLIVSLFWGLIRLNELNLTKRSLNFEEILNCPNQMDCKFTNELIWNTNEIEFAFGDCLFICLFDNKLHLVVLVSKINGKFKQSNSNDWNLIDLNIEFDLSFVGRLVLIGLGELINRNEPKIDWKDLKKNTRKQIQIKSNFN